MARDAIARQYDVDKNLVTLTCEPEVPGGKKGYRPGLITFFPKKGKSLDLDKMQESIAATRLSGGTNMGVDWLELTLRGEVVLRDKEMLFKVSGTDQEFVLDQEASAKAAFPKLRETVAGGAKVTTVTGRVPGWSGRFPDVLKALTKAPARRTLLGTDFEAK
jgi:hypothetical protein